MSDISIKTNRQSKVAWIPINSSLGAGGILDIWMTGERIKFTTLSW